MNNRKTGNISYFVHMSKTSDAIKQLHGQVVGLLKEKKDDTFIVDYLEQQGVERYYAEMILENFCAAGGAWDGLRRF